MNKIEFNELKKHYNEEVTLKGFIDNIRDLQYVQFMILRDRTGKVQVTIEKNDENKSLNEIVSGLTLESTVKVTGKLLESPKVKLNGMEVIPTSIEVTSVSESELPINYKDQSSSLIDTKLDYRFLDLRNEKNILMFKVQSAFVEGMRDFLYKNEFIEIHTPKLIAAASESGSDVFAVDYFDRTAYLAQSPQFYKQMAMASGFEKIFEVAPAFRAENSNTNRHATEFTSFDVEFSYIDSFNDVMNLEEDLLIAGLTKVKEKYENEIKNLFNVDVVVPTKPFPRIKLQDLYKELEKRYNYNIPTEDVGDMNAETEKLTSRYAMEEFGHEFIFVTDFSKKKRAFYHMRENDIPQGYDLIWKGTEITTGAQREHRYEILKTQAEEKGLKDDVKFYLDFFKYGCPPHGGFALGIDRMTMLLLGVSSVKESMFLFRGPNRLTP
ncbi:nucleic acid-binding domain protein [Clostridium sp. CAG:1193]|mgnify:FL=1|nr:nucleic acid-binding domain protein [Clostridium sp. CAG:1193]